MEDDKPYIVTNVDVIAKQKAKRSHPQVRTREVRLLVTDVSAQRLVTITPDEYSKLAIDQRYQREDIKDWVANLRDAIRRGAVPPPIHVAKRSFAEDGEVSKKYWIVDGQQRMWALVDANKSIQALVHEVESLEHEKKLFHILNSRRRLGANHAIATYPGPSAYLLREINDRPSHSLYKRILLSNYTGSHARINAASIVSCALVASVGRARGTAEMLSRMDAFIKSPNGAEQITEFLNSLGRVFDGRPSFEMMLSFAATYRKLGRTLTSNEIGRLRRLKLERIVASTSRDRIHLMSRHMLRALGQSEDE